MKSEILGLTWDDIDLDNAIIDVNKQLNHSGENTYMIAI